jgi:glutathione S-transferase
MAKPRLVYFDAPVSRGEECRIALHVAGVDFEDARFPRSEWPSKKPTTPFGSVPVYEVPGKPPIAQSNAILALVGRQHGLHPKDEFEAARHEAMMMYVEELRAQLNPTTRIQDDAERKRVREQLVAGFIPTWAANVEKQIGDGPFFGGASLSVVDIKLYSIVKWFKSGTLDHVPTTIFDGCPKLVRLHDAVRDHAGVKSWHAKR